jgi:hypothetical protein
MVAMVTLILVILYALIEKILRSKDEGKEKQQQYNHEYKDNIKYRPKYYSHKPWAAIAVRESPYQSLYETICQRFVPNRPDDFLYHLLCNSTNLYAEDLYLLE